VATAALFASAVTSGNPGSFTRGDSFDEMVRDDGSELIVADDGDREMLSTAWSVGFAALMLSIVRSDGEGELGAVRHGRDVTSSGWLEDIVPKL